MTFGWKMWKVGWRLGISLLLLGWILHSIFLNEARFIWEGKGQPWDALSTWQRWKMAWNYGPPELLRTLGLIEPGHFLFSILLMGLTIVLGVLRWQMILRAQGLELPFSRATAISLVAHFFNSFLLGSTGGDLIKAYYAARETHHKKTEAVVTVFMDRLIGLWTMLLFAVLMMVPNRHLLGSDRRLVLIVLVIGGMFATGTVLLSLALWGGVSQRWPNARALLRRIPKGDLLERSLESCRDFGRKPQVLGRAVILSMALNTLCVLQFLTLVDGLRLTISAVAMFAIVPMIICISALPITPSGLGVRENLFVLMLSVPLIHVAQTSALSLSLLAYAGSLFWSLGGGLVYLFLREREHLEEVTKADEESV